LRRNDAFNVESRPRTGQAADDEVVIGTSGAAACVDDDDEFCVEGNVEGERVFSGRIRADVGEIIQAEIVGVKGIEISHGEHGTTGGVEADADASIRACVREGVSVEVEGADSTVSAGAGFGRGTTAGDTAGEKTVGEGGVTCGDGV